MTSFGVSHADGGQYHLISQEGHGIKVVDSIRRKGQTASHQLPCTNRTTVPDNAEPSLPVELSSDDEGSEETVVQDKQGPAGTQLVRSPEEASPEEEPAPLEEQSQEEHSQEEAPLGGQRAEPPEDTQEASQDVAQEVAIEDAQATQEELSQMFSMEV